MPQARRRVTQCSYPGSSEPSLPKSLSMSLRGMMIVTSSLSAVVALALILPWQDYSSHGYGICRPMYYLLLLIDVLSSGLPHHRPCMTLVTLCACARGKVICSMCFLLMRTTTTQVKVVCAWIIWRWVLILLQLYMQHRCRKMVKVGGAMDIIARENFLTPPTFHWNHAHLSLLLLLDHCWKLVVSQPE